MNILITGAAGYLGSIMVPTMRNSHRDWRITALDNFLYGVPSLSPVAIDPGVKIMRGDARDQDLMTELMRDADVIIPLAAIVGAPACDLDHTACWTTNKGAVTMACKLSSREQRFIVPITNSGYGIGEKGVECTEESPLRPLSQYGVAKVEAEDYVMARRNAVSLRLATVFGMSARMRMDLLVNDFVWQAVTRKSITLFEAHAMRNYVHVRDVALAFIHVIEQWDKLKDNIFNVGDTRANCSKLDLALAVKKHVPGFSIMVDEFERDHDQRDYMVSNAKFEATGWKPFFTLDDGIAELINGYQQFKKVAHGNA